MLGCSCFCWALEQLGHVPVFFIIYKLGSLDVGVL